MPRPLTLRQVEAFKAVIEHGTISNAAQILHISQPAMSKLIAHFEADTGLQLFDRLKGRLAPTEHGMRLYEEIDRIFAGVRQVENAVQAIRREEQGQLAVGVMPALSGSFIQRVTTRFLQDRPGVFCSVQSRSSHWIADWLVTRKLDVGLVSARIDNPYIAMEPLMEHPLVCIMPLQHPLAARSHIEPQDLEHVPFVTFNSDSDAGRRVAAVLETYRVRTNITVTANVSSTLCELVAAGLGVSLVHPLMVSGLEDRVAVRCFEPEVLFDFRLCSSRDNRNARLVQAFLESARATAALISNTLLGKAQKENRTPARNVRPIRS
jgi:DNA-binding transcriptional LysR family regulator